MANPVSGKPVLVATFSHVLNKPVKALISLFFVKLKYTAESYPRAAETRPPAFSRRIVFRQAVACF
jgi:hypothetical protein